MDKSLYDQVKQLQVYSEIVNMGYKDISTNQQIKLGSIKFCNDEADLEYSITGKSGKVYQYAGKNAVIADFNKPMISVHDYDESLSVILSRVIKRKKDAYKTLSKDKHLSIRVLFAISPISIYKLSSYIKYRYSF